MKYIYATLLITPYRQVTNLTSDEAGAGAGAGFAGGRDAKRNLKQAVGVVEARPGIIESTHIDPLNEHSGRGMFQPNENSFQHFITTIADDSWTHKPSGNATSGARDSAASMTSSAAGMAAGAARVVYGTAVGDEEVQKAGKEAVWGQNA